MGMENYVHNKFKVLENTAAFLTKATFNDLRALKKRMNGHDEDLGVLGEFFQTFLESIN